MSELPNLDRLICRGALLELVGRCHCSLHVRGRRENKEMLCVLSSCITYVSSTCYHLCVASVQRQVALFFFFNPRGRLKTQDSARHPGTCLQSQHPGSYARKIAASGRNLDLHSEYQQGPPCLKNTQSAPGPRPWEAPEGPGVVCEVYVQGSVQQERVREFWLIPEV